MKTVDVCKVAFPPVCYGEKLCDLNALFRKS